MEEVGSCGGGLGFIEGTAVEPRQQRHKVMELQMFLKPIANISTIKKTVIQLPKVASPYIKSRLVSAGLGKELTPLNEVP